MREQHSELYADGHEFNPRVEPIFLQLKILDIYKINDYLCSLFMYRFNYCQNLPDFYDYFKQNNELHNYNTQNSTKLHVSYKRTNYCKYTVFNKGVSIRNCLDEEIKNIKSYFSFKKTAIVCVFHCKLSLLRCVND